MPAVHVVPNIYGYTVEHFNSGKTRLQMAAKDLTHSAVTAALVATGRKPSL